MQQYFCWHIDMVAEEISNYPSKIKNDSCKTENDSCNIQIYHFTVNHRYLHHNKWCVMRTNEISIATKNHKRQRGNMSTIQPIWIPSEAVDLKLNLLSQIYIICGLILNEQTAFLLKVYFISTMILATKIHYLGIQLSQQQQALTVY